VNDKYTVQTIAPTNAMAVVSTAGVSATSGASFDHRTAMLRPIKPSRDANGAPPESRARTRSAEQPEENQHPHSPYVPRLAGTLSPDRFATCAARGIFCLQQTSPFLDTARGAMASASRESAPSDAHPGTLDLVANATI
jgi:hypothetical protein